MNKYMTGLVALLLVFACFGAYAGPPIGVEGEEGGEAIFKIHPDQGDDADDQMRIVGTTTGNLSFRGTSGTNEVGSLDMSTGTLTLDGGIAVITANSASTNITITSAHYNTILMVTSNAAVTVTLPANGAAAGSSFELMTGAGSTDSCAPTISAATTDTLVGPDDQDLDSVTWGTGHRIGAHAKFISDGSYWHVLNLGGTTMTYTD